MMHWRKGGYGGVWTRSLPGSRVVSRDPTMAHSGVGRSILACLPCMVARRSPRPPNSYENIYDTLECYQSALVSRQILSQTCALAQLRHKEQFPYEYARKRRRMLLHACACYDTILTVW